MNTATNPTIARLAALCDEWCGINGLRRGDIAERAGMMPQALSRLLGGEIDPSISRVERVLRAIGRGLADLDGESVGSGPGPT